MKRTIHWMSVCGHWFNTIATCAFYLRVERAVRGSNVELRIHHQQKDPTGLWPIESTCHRRSVVSVWKKGKYI